MMNVLSIKYITGVMLLVACVGCEDFVAVDLPSSKIVSDAVFENDNTAIAAVSGLYHDMQNSMGFASGGQSSVTVTTALSAGELDFYSTSFSDLGEFQQRDVNAENGSLLTLWSSAYNTIYGANAIIEGLESSTAVTPGTRDQLLGEALFVRAFTYFYLVNLFGDVPLATTTDYRVNATLGLADIETVYAQLIDDLLRAVQLLGPEYVSADRVRPSRWTAHALLARVYLYRGEWEAAETHASEVIAQTGHYTLTPLDGVFVKSTQEAIWQLIPVRPNFNTNEGNTFIPITVPVFALSEGLMQAFDDKDSRKSSWILPYEYGGEVYSVPYKYKVANGSEITEYAVVLRLAEQFLIRAEARAQLNDPAGAIADLDAIRGRAGIGLLANSAPELTGQALLDAIERERRRELFTEWGHRWLDLKRVDRIPVEAAFYPIPAEEIRKNPNLLRK